MEKYAGEGDILQQAISETKGWRGWNEENEIFKEVYCRVG